MHAEGISFWLNDLKALKGQNLKFKQIDFIAFLTCLIKETNGSSLGKLLLGKAYTNFVSP